MKKILKNIVELIPYSIGSKLVFVPFKYRLGRAYTNFSKKILFYNKLKISEKEKFIVEQFSRIFEFAKINYPFYKNLYTRYGVYDLKITNIEDIKKIPIISKKDLRLHLSQFKGSLKLNTGGTSGEPFSFYVDKEAFAREWAHMHDIWKKKEYKHKDLKITLRGKDLGEKNIVYNPVHNEFIINTYRSVKLFKEEFIQLMRSRNIKFIHGYPSAIYNLLKEFDEVSSNKEKELLKNSVRACFLGSEFPTPIIRKYLTEFWNLDYISWYGHSEMCILASDDKNTNEYIPYNTYGYTEVVDGKLIGTSYYNFDMPLIRYDTGDIVSAEYTNENLLKNFTITQGREGEFIVDTFGKMIPLTALIFGRHHKAFDYVDFIQVKQDEDTKEVTFYLISKNKLTSENEMLNLKGVSINYSIKFIEKPFKTKAGKVKLKI